MPIIKSAKKRAKQTIKRYQINLARKSALKSAVKKVITAIEEKNAEQARTFLKEAESQIARAKGKHLLHKNTAARKISRLAKRVAMLERQ